MQQADGEAQAAAAASNSSRGKGNGRGRKGGYGAFPFLFSSFLMQQEPSSPAPGSPMPTPNHLASSFERVEIERLGSSDPHLPGSRPSSNHCSSLVKGATGFQALDWVGGGWGGALTPNIDLREYVPSCSVRSAFSRVLAVCPFSCIIAIGRNNIIDEQPETHLNAILLLFLRPTDTRISLPSQVYLSPPCAQAPKHPCTPPAQPASFVF